MRRAVAAMAILLLLTACGGGSPPVTGIAATGEELFSRTVLGDNPGCTTCHSLKPGTVLVGPSLATIGIDASTREASISARDYLLESITAPDAFVVEGFDPGRMPPDWSDQLAPDEIDAIVEYLITLGAG